jgi:hypothetical protein
MEDRLYNIDQLLIELLSFSKLIINIILSFVNNYYIGLEIILFYEGSTTIFNNTNDDFLTKSKFIENGIDSHE